MPSSLRTRILHASRQRVSASISTATRELADPCHKALIGRSPCECDVVMVLDRHAVVNESPESTATGVLDRWPHFETLSDSSQTPEQHSDVFYLRTVTFG